MGAKTTAPEGFIRGKTPSPVPGDPDIPSCLLLDDPINELLLSVGLCADRVLIPNRHCANGGVVAIRQNTN
jgi:hypothetical protein